MNDSQVKPITDERAKQVILEYVVETRNDPIPAIDPDDEALADDLEAEEIIRRRQTTFWRIVGRTRRPSLVQFRYRKCS